MESVDRQRGHIVPSDGLRGGCKQMRFGDGRGFQNGEAAH